MESINSELIAPHIINQAVARKLGWMEHTCKTYEATKHWYRHAYKHTVCCIDEGLPNYAKSMDAAFEIIAHIQAQGGRVRIEDNSESDYKQDRSLGAWHCDFWTDQGWVCVNAETFPVALCLAFLKLDTLQAAN